MQDVAFDANGRCIKCVLSMKFFAFHMNFGKYLNFGTSENFWKKRIVQICFIQGIFFHKNVFSDNFFSKNFSLLSRPLHCIKVICKETAYFT